MDEKLLLGCAWCERTDADLGPCCRRHVRLVCQACTETEAYLREHQSVSEPA